MRNFNSTLELIGFRLYPRFFCVENLRNTVMNDHRGDTDFLYVPYEHFRTYRIGIVKIQRTGLTVTYKNIKTL